MNESTCRRTRELLPWYLNRSLEEGERQEVEQHLETCAECRSELAAVRWAYRLYAQHLPAAAVLAYVSGDEPRLDLGGGASLDRAVAEEHLAFCAACSDEVAMARESFEALAGDAAEDSGRGEHGNRGERGNVVPFAPRRQPDTGFGWGRRLAVAASILFAVVAAGGWLTASQRAREHAGTVAELESRLEAAQAAAAAEERQPRGTDPDAGGDPRTDLQAQVETLTAELDRLTSEAEQGQRALAALEQRFRQPSLSVAVVLAGVTRSGGAPGEIPELRLGADGATLVVSLSGVTGTQPVRITGEGDVAYDLEPQQVPVVDGTPLLTLHLPPGFLPPGDYVLELPRAGKRQPFRLVAGD